MENMPILAEREDSCLEELIWVAQEGSVVMVSSTVERNAMRELRTADLPTDVVQIVLFHIAVMELPIPTMENGVILVFTMMISLATALPLAFQMNAALGLLLLEDSSTTPLSSIQFPHLQ